jgi:hypothetical protein
VATWFWYAVVAAVLYGAHQIFTRMAANHIGEGLGGFVVEATAALSILAYLAFLWLVNRWDQKSSPSGIIYSVLTGLRRRRNNCILSTLSKRRSTFICSSDPGRRRGHHGARWHLLFPRTAILAANRRHWVCNYRFVFSAQIRIEVVVDHSI